MSKVDIKISGLHCMSCKALIESEVKAINKVKNINVNHQTGNASVEFDGNIEEVYKTIEDLGYGIVREEKTEDKTSKKKILF